MALTRKGCRFRLDPTRRQLDGFIRIAGARRWVWNWALERRIRHFREHRSLLSYIALSNELTSLKRQPDTRWLQKADAQALQQAIRDLDRSFRAFFARRARFPRFKSKKRDKLTFRIPQSIRVTNNRVYVPKVGWVRMRQSRPIEGRITSATFTRDVLGRWDVSLAVEVDFPDAPLPPVDASATIGIDQGLSDFIVLPDGNRVGAPRYYRKAERRLRRAQRHLSRCRPGSRHRELARRRVARIHQRIANQRRDFVHKITTHLVRSHHGVCIQKLSVSGLARTKLAKSVLDAALGELHRQLAYKSNWYRRHFVVIDLWFPSTRLCGQCGALNDTLLLSDREWLCVCGATHDRDINAARNIRAEGLRLLGVAAGHAETENARRKAVRLPMGAGLDEARIPAC
ncbi:MAG TPA: transposase [bacterium]|nr:transposase [bacterium]